MIHIWTDGSSRGNPGLGGFGVIVIANKNILYTYSERYDDVTNNQMELKAILHAFKIADEKYPEEICIVHSDSKYCVQICNNWAFKWAKNNWKKTNDQLIENLELIQSLYKYLIKDFYHCQVIKTKGHSNIIENELVDSIAKNNINKFKKIVEDNNFILDKILII